MRREIPGPVMAVIAELVSARETHATLDNLFPYAGAPGDPPEGNKLAKALAWLRRVNKELKIDPLKVLGQILEPYMDCLVDEDNSWDQSLIAQRKRIVLLLSGYGLRYVHGGSIASGLGTPTRTLSDYIRAADLTAIEREFDRAINSVNENPREAVSAASNILESVCKIYIEDEGLERPAKQDLQSVWGVVRKDLGLDPSQVQDRDLQQILSGMISVVHGIGSLRTHASSAHGEGRKGYRLEPRHARLAIHAAHTLVLFVLESWQKKRA